MRSLFLLFGSLLGLGAQAAHILGGEMYYTYMGNDNYDLTIKFYRDCGGSGADFDIPLYLGVFGTNGFEDQVDVNSMEPVIDVPVTLNNPCLTPTDDQCVELGIYHKTLHLPAANAPYTITWQRCCRPPGVLNLAVSNEQGLTLTITVPDITVTGENSSPRFDLNPPTSLCLGQEFIFDHSATDPDGDSLVYDLYAPLDGANIMIPNPTMPDPPPYVPVSFAAGFSVNDMVESSPPMTIDPHTGELRLTPAGLGAYTVGVRVKEYRNGVLLSTAIRDTKFTFVTCVVDVHSTIAAQNDTSFCNGLTVQMANNSIGGGFFHWDFGVAGTLADTSDQEAPAFTYPGPGIYEVTLIANPNWPCADTSHATFELYPPVELGFDVPYVICPDQMPLTVSATGNITAAADVQWDFGNGFSPDTDAHTTTVQFPGLGAFAIRLTASENGCSGEFIDSVRVYPPPTVEFGPDTGGCTPFRVPFTNGSSAWTPMQFLWEFGDGATSTDSLPQHVYTGPGTYDVKLSVSTTSGCVATRSLLHEDLVENWSLPIARFTADPMVVSLLEPEVTFVDHSVDVAAWDLAVEGVHYDTAPVTHRFSDAGPFPALLTVTNANGCIDTASTHVLVGDHLFFAPAAFTPNGDGVNETWRAEVRGARAYRIEVFDRWGHIVFSSTDPTKVWDGKDATTGIYAFKAWLTEWGPLEKEYNGTITLFR